MVVIDSNRIRFIPKEERWEPPYNDNIHRPERDEYYVVTIGRTCPECGELGWKNSSCEINLHRDLSSIRITRNFESQKFVLYIDGESVVEGQWADTPSGRGPNGHKDVLYEIKMFAKGWMAAEEEIPVQDIHVHSHGIDHD